MLSRLLHGLLPVAGAVLAVSMVSFALVAFLPGDLALIMLGDSATPELLAAARQQLGLGRPLYERYLPWLGGGVSGGLRGFLPSGGTGVGCDGGGATGQRGTDGADRARLAQPVDSTWRLVSLPAGPGC